MADSTLNIHINTGGAKKNLDGVNASLKDTEQQSKKTESSIDKLNGTVKRLAGALVAGGLLKSIFTLTGNFEQLSYTLGVVYGSIDRGNAVFKDLQKLAKETPFQIEDLTQSVIKLRSAGLEPTSEMMATFADVASASSDQIGTLQAVTDLFSRSLAGGLGLEDLNRLADRGIPVFKILKDELNLTRLEIAEFGKTAQGSTTILKTLLKSFEGLYGGRARDAAEQLNNEISNFQINLKLLANTLAGGKATDMMAKGFKLASEALVELGNNADIVAAVLAALAISTLPALLSVLGKVVGLLWANPFGIAAAAIGALGVAVYVFREELYQTFMVSLPNWIDAATVKIKLLAVAFKQVFKLDTSELERDIGKLYAAMEERTFSTKRPPIFEFFESFKQGVGDAIGGLVSVKDAYQQLDEAGKAGGGIAKIGGDAKTAADQIDEMAQKANSLTLSLRTSTEVFQDMISELDEMLDKGLITMETYIRGIDEAEKQLNNALKTDKPREQLNDLQMAIEGFSRNAASSFVDMTKGVEGAFGRMVQTMIDELIRLMAQMLLFDPIFKAFGGWMGGIAGGVMGGAGAGSVTAFGSGGVVSGATPFGFSGGRVGVAGEAGPEAILPLTRTSSGDLGVKAGGASPKVTVNVNNQTNGQADVAVTSSPSGDSIDIMITSAVAAGIAGGRFDSAFKSTYGLRRRGF